MKTYISGPISSDPDYIKHFSEAESFLLGTGDTPVSPSKLDCAEEGLVTHSWNYFMRKALQMLCECEAIYMLEGYEKSRGARLELSVAKELDMLIYFEKGEDL